MTVEDATAQMIEATDAATAEAEAWAHGNSFTATEMFTSAGSATVTLAYSPSSINVVKINDVATTAYTRNDKVITFNTAPAVGSTITVIYGVSTSTDNAKYYKDEAATSAANAGTSATTAESYAIGGTGTRTGEDTDNAKYYKEQADTSATSASTNATKSESFAVGGTGTRIGEDSDNAKYYYEQARDISASITGALKPCGTVTYVNLPSLSVALVGDMYNVSDAFTTTNDFKEGAGHHIAAGANVYKTSDAKWDILAGVTVTGVKGDKEQNYRQGNINLTPANIGAIADPSTAGTNGQVLTSDGSGGASWQNAQSPLVFDNVPTQGSNNPVKSGGIFSTMAVPKYDSANRREYYEGGGAFGGNIDSTPTAGSNNAVASGGVYTALTLHDNATVKQLNIYKANNVVSIYGLLNNLDPTQTIIAYATLDAKYRPASGYAVGALISTTAPYLPVGSVWVNGSTAGVYIYKEAARTDGYLYLTYLT